MSPTQLASARPAPSAVASTPQVEDSFRLWLERRRMRWGDSLVRGTALFVASLLIHAGLASAAWYLASALVGPWAMPPPSGHHSIELAASIASSTGDTL